MHKPYNEIKSGMRNIKRNVKRTKKSYQRDGDFKYSNQGTWLVLGFESLGKLSLDEDNGTAWFLLVKFIQYFKTDSHIIATMPGKHFENSINKSLHA